MKNAAGKEFVTALYPSPDALFTMERVEALWRLDELRLVLLIHTLENGRLPPKLDVLGSIPMDPYGGCDFGYDASKGIIWSIGWDGIVNPEWIDIADVFDRNSDPWRMNDPTLSIFPEQHPPLSARCPW